MAKTPLKVRTIRLSDEHWSTIARLAKKYDRSDSYVLRQIIDKYINEINDNLISENKSGDTP